MKANKGGYSSHLLLKNVLELTKEKARYIQFVRAGQRLPAPNHITQRKPLASQAILLQANDWTFLYDLEGQLQFPIEAAVTSLRPDVVLFSRSSKTIVLLRRQRLSPLLSLSSLSLLFFFFFSFSPLFQNLYFSPQSSSCYFDRAAG